MKRILLLLMVMMPILTIHAQAPMAGGEWKDNTGRHINAHGGCIINYKGTYYWYGENHSSGKTLYSSKGVSCYTSKDLQNWTNKGVGVPFQVGLHEDLIRINAGTGLDSHHVGQKSRNGQISEKLRCNKGSSNSCSFGWSYKN